MKAKLDEMTLKEVREAGAVEVAVLPWGSCEPHGLHLPYGTDTFSAVRVGELACRKAVSSGARVALLPAIPFGYNGNQFAFPLTVSVKPTTQLAILRDVIESLAWHGIRKLLILNGHGGNEFRALLRELYPGSGCCIFLIDWWVLAEDAASRCFGRDSMTHAGKAETSWSLHLFPELVHPSWADEGEVRRPRLASVASGWAWMPRPWHSYTKSSGEGSPSGASPETGEKLVEEAAEKIAAFLAEFSAASVDDSFPY